MDHEYHHLLQRQIRRHLPNMDSFLMSVNKAYQELEQDRLMAERSLDLMSKELLEKNAEVMKTLKELQRTQDQLVQSEKMSAIGQLAGGVAHDFNNLLTIILGYSTAEDVTRADLDEVVKAGKRAMTLVAQLLAFSRKQIIQPTLLDLRVVIDHVSNLLRRLVREDIELVIIHSASPIQVKMDQGQLEQVLINMVVNARDAMPNGGKIVIDTSVKGGAYAQLAISDSGCGMPADIRAHIFEPFFTTKGKDKGSGLGLATCYGIVKQANGDISVYSELNQGTVFKIYLPLAQEPTAVLPEPGKPLELPAGKETVLLVEDEASLRHLVKKTLSKQGYRVLEAGNGAEVFDMLKTLEVSIDLLLSDVIMPHMGGKELADKMRERFPKLKVLFASGYTDAAIDHQGVLDAGVNFIQKPFLPEDLAIKVRRVLDAH